MEWISWLVEEVDKLYRPLKLDHAQQKLEEMYPRHFEKIRDLEKFIDTPTDEGSRSSPELKRVCEEIVRLHSGAVKAYRISWIRDNRVAKIMPES